MKRILTLAMIMILILLSSCSGSVGNTKTNDNFFEYIDDIDNQEFDFDKFMERLYEAQGEEYNRPVAYYRLIENNTAYELLAVENSYFGSYFVSTTYKDANGIYGELPVTEISSCAFAGNSSINNVYIGKNITYVGENAFDGWTISQKIHFEISQEESLEFDPLWNKNSNAMIIWDNNQSNLYNYIDYFSRYSTK